MKNTKGLAPLIAISAILLALSVGSFSIAVYFAC